MIDRSKIGGSLTAGDIVHLDPRKLPEIVIISETEANAIADANPVRTFVVTEARNNRSLISPPKGGMRR